jgi:hypothetical protein
LEVVYKTANDILLKAMPFIFRYVLVKMPPAKQVAFLLLMCLWRQFSLASGIDPFILSELF